MAPDSPTQPHSLPVVLVHGGLYQDTTAESFWGEPGILVALDERRIDWAAAQRPARPADWVEEARAIADAVELTPRQRAVVVAGGDGCSAALRLAVDSPDLVARLVLAWPVTAGDPVADELVRATMSELGSASAAGALLSGGTVRGVTDDEIAGLDMPVVVWPTFPENQLHQGATASRLIELLRHPILVGGSPLPTSPAFDGFAGPFVDLVAEAAFFDDDDLVE